MVKLLGKVVDVVFEISYIWEGNGYVDFYCEHMDVLVLFSTFWDYEDLLINDGCIGIVVFNFSIL